MLDLKILRAWRHVQEELGRLQQYVDVFFLRRHSVDEHEDTTHDDQCQYVEKKSATFHIRLPN